MDNERCPPNIKSGTVVHVSDVVSNGVMLSEYPGSTPFLLSFQDLRYENRMPNPNEINKGEMIILNILPDGSGKLSGTMVKSSDSKKNKGKVMFIGDDFLLVAYKNEFNNEDEILIQTCVVSNFRELIDTGTEIEFFLSAGQVVKANLIEIDERKEKDQKLEEMLNKIPPPELIFQPYEMPKQDYSELFKRLPCNPDVMNGSNFPQDKNSAWVPFNFPKKEEVRSLERKETSLEMNQILDNYKVMLNHIKLLHHEINELTPIINTQKKVVIAQKVNSSWNSYSNLNQDSAKTQQIHSILMLQKEVSDSILSMEKALLERSNPLYVSEIIPNPMPAPIIPGFPSQGSNPSHGDFHRSSTMPLAYSAGIPSYNPSNPLKMPSYPPSSNPNNPFNMPSYPPSSIPSNPSNMPSYPPSSNPSNPNIPSYPSFSIPSNPSNILSYPPSFIPSNAPNIPSYPPSSISNYPSSIPSNPPSNISNYPSSIPSNPPNIPGYPPSNISSYLTSTPSNPPPTIPSNLPPMMSSYLSPNSSILLPPRSDNLVGPSPVQRSNSNTPSGHGPLLNSSPPYSSSDTIILPCKHSTSSTDLKKYLEGLNIALNPYDNSFSMKCIVSSCQESISSVSLLPFLGKDYLDSLFARYQYKPDSSVAYNSYSNS